jgi:hypothetical protein
VFLSASGKLFLTTIKEVAWEFVLLPSPAGHVMMLLVQTPDIPVHGARLCWVAPVVMHVCTGSLAMSPVLDCQNVLLMC